MYLPAMSHKALSTPLRAITKTPRRPYIADEVYIWVPQQLHVQRVHADQKIAQMSMDDLGARGAASTKPITDNALIGPDDDDHRTC